MRGEEIQRSNTLIDLIRNLVESKCSKRSASELRHGFRLTLVFVQSRACSNRERTPAEVLASAEGSNNAI